MKNSKSPYVSRQSMIKKFLTNTKDVDFENMPDRSIETNAIDVNKQFPNNKIKTTSYTFLTFIPIQLFLQLIKPVNFYFLIIAALQTVPAISNSGGKPTGLYPLLFVLTIVLIKDAYEQFYRYQKDKQQNNRKVQYINPNTNRIELTSWQNLQVSNIILLKCDDLLPCDVILLSSSDEKGRCYVQTKNLDGQNNLKVKKVPSMTLNKLELQKLKIQLVYDRPDPSLFRFKGRIKFLDQQLPLTLDNLLLKGSSIKITTKIYGACVYTGNQTKLSLNSVKFRQKVSNLENSLNKIVLIIIGLQLFLSIICAVMNLLFEGSRNKQLLDIKTSSFWIQVAVWCMILSYMVPISLVVTMQVVKLFQVTYMIRDNRLYSKMSECLPSSNSSSVNENLGQIKYIFSDKTGTLTSNIMKFKKLIVNGKQFGKDQSLQAQELARYPQVENVEFRDKKFLNNTKQYDDFFKVLSLCHTVIINENRNTGEIQYSASSPDQLALVNFSKFCGYEYLGEINEKLIVFNRHQNKKYQYKLLATLEFNSDRKRMSVIIENQKKQIVMYTKGADNIMQKLLKNQTKTLQQTKILIDSFASEGLRTLMITKRVLNPVYFNNWKKKYHEATISMLARQQMLDEVSKQIQVELELIGATGVQDKLQARVKQTIQHIKRSDITFYILTGDKKQTAINIAFSCGMLDKNTKIISPPSQFQNIQDFEERQKKNMEWIRQNSPFQPNSVFLLDASLDLPQIPLHPTICYRCTPTKKQFIIKSVKTQTDQLTLAIGDGSNDVNMIVAADVGIGIRGKQGNQVCRVADFVIGQFSILQRLLFYYGREWYRRNSKLINYSYFKNIYHVFTVIGYGTWSFFSGKIIYQNMMYELFNVFFATIPIMVYALFDQQYDLKESLENPSLYSKGQNNQYFNQWTYWKTILLGAVIGILSEIFVYYAMEKEILTYDGRISYASESGMVLYFNIILVVNIKILLLSHSTTPLLIISVFGTLIVYWICYVIIMKLMNPYIQASFFTQFNTLVIYLIHLVLASIILFLDYGVKQYFLFTKRLINKENKQYHRRYYIE